MLRILLRNLIDNAVRHTRPETSVQINIANDQYGQVLLTVSDNGPGIADAEMCKVTERFYRPLGTVASGSGLGLSIVKRIAEIHSAALQLTARQNASGLCVSLIFNPLESKQNHSL
jgi:two-component system sensor histidine kinase QseC